MGYIEDNLMPNEKILLISKLSYAVFIPPIMVFFIALLILIFSLNQAGKQNDAASAIAGMLICVAGIFFISSIIVALSELVRFFTTEFAVTNRRIIAKSGFIRRDSLDLRLVKVESVEVNQNILGRLLSIGTITITGTGGTRQSFRGIVDPIKTKRKINQIVEHYNSQMTNQNQVQ